MLIERCSRLWDALRRMPARNTRRSSRVLIAPEHIDGGSAAGGRFRPDEHYFQVQMSELYLTFERQWFANYDPLLLVISEFLYDTRPVALPAVVGPALLSQQMRKSAEGLLFFDQRMAGWHPYCGGPLTIAVALCRVPREPYTRSLLRMIERAASRLDFATAFRAYLQVADVVLEGLESLVHVGAIAPLLGFRNVLDPAMGHSCTPGYWALIDRPASHLERHLLRVHDNQLMEGATPEAAVPFRRADYLLYRLAQTNQRGDIAALPFYPLYEQVRREAAAADAASWRRARVHMFTLFGSMVQSPDLTPAQVTVLQTKTSVEMQRLHRKAQQQQERAYEQ